MTVDMRRYVTVVQAEQGERQVPSTDLTSTQTEPMYRVVAVGENVTVQYETLEPPTLGETLTVNIREGSHTT